MPVLHLAIAQFRPRKGDVNGNTKRIGEILAQAAALDSAPDVVHFAETVLSGYFVEGAVREMAITAPELAASLGAAYVAAGGSRAIDAIIGFYERHEGTLHNSAAFLSFDPAGHASVVHVHRKNFLPTYGMFDEGRRELSQTLATLAWMARMAVLPEVSSVGATLPPREPIEHARRWPTKRRSSVHP